MSGDIATYRPHWLFRNGHIATIWSGLIRRVDGLEQGRERVELADGDFMDLDWSYASTPTRKVVVLLHGLEGNGQRPYMTGSAKIFNSNGYDACAVNFRGCSGETNRLYRSYHSGATEDLEAVINHIVDPGNYTDIIIKGFSLGGNMALKYAGEGRLVPKEIKGIVGISVPCDLHSSLVELLKLKNILYARRFRKHLVQKLLAKQKLFPALLPDSDLRRIHTLKDFDDIYTSRAHGFADALDYYRQCSCGQFLSGIKIPVLILNSRNDSFLGADCYPQEAARTNAMITLETPDYGGHVGFYGSGDHYYSEKRAINFVKGIQ